MIVKIVQTCSNLFQFQGQIYDQVFGSELNLTFKSQELESRGYPYFRIFFNFQ